MNRMAFLCLLFLASDSAGAELSCTDRILKLAAPELPKYTSALHAIARGACSVDVIFSLSKEGVATVIGAGSSEERCKVLERFARKAVASSEFSAGQVIDNCTIRITFDTDEMVPVAMWGKPAEETDGNDTWRRGAPTG